jgi:hypothetical protein
LTNNIDFRRETVAKTKQTKAVSHTSKTGGHASKKVTKTRGGLLSFLIILIGVHAAFATYLAYTTLQEPYRTTSWVIPVLALCAVANIVAAVGLWYWKLWAFYLYLGTSLVTAVVHVLLTGSGWVVFYDLLPVAVLGYVINLQHKMDYFE